MNKKYIFLTIILFALLQAACGGGSAADHPRAREEAEKPQEVGKINSRLLSTGLPASTGTSPDGYLIGPADLLEITVFESKELTSTVRVSSRGDITVPLLNNVDVDGLTARETEVKLENLLRSGGYIDNPHVGVFVKEHRSKVVSVMGHVNKPGSYELLGRRTVLDVLADAEGLSDTAGTTVMITRSGKDGARSSYLVDLDELVSGSNSMADQSLDVQPGDLVYVPEAANVFVEGAVSKPGAYPINEGKTTLSEAIVMAGGVASYADEGDVKLIRNVGGNKEIVDVDLDSIREGSQTDPVLGEKDAVIVGASGIKSFFYGFKFNIWGLGGVGYEPPNK